MTIFFKKTPWRDEKLSPSDRSESKITEIHRAWIPVIYITIIILSEIILLYNVQ